MPDENANPIVGTQTLQDNQATTNQTGNDFVLDFGGGEETVVENSINSANEVKFEDSNMSMENMGFGGENLVSQNETTQEINQEDLFGETEKESEDTSNQVDLGDFYVGEQESKQEDSFDIGFENESSDEEKLDQNPEDLELEQKNEDLPNEGELYGDKTFQQDKFEESLNLNDNTVQGTNVGEPDGEFSMELELEKPMGESLQDNNDSLNEIDNSRESETENNFEEIKMEEKVEGPEPNIVFDEVENENQVNNNDVLEEPEGIREVLTSVEENTNKIENKEEAEPREENLSQSFDLDNRESINQVENENKVGEILEDSRETLISDVENKEEQEQNVDGFEDNFVLNSEDNTNQEENKEKFADDDTNFVLTDDPGNGNVFQESGKGEESLENVENVDIQNDNLETKQNENSLENAENNGEDTNKFTMDITEDSSVYNSNDNQDSIATENNQTNGEFVMNNSTSENENISDNANKFQDNEPISDSNPISNDGNTQPDMMNLLGGQSVDFSYEENAIAIQQPENNLEAQQDVVESQGEIPTNSQNSSGLSIENNENVVSNVNNPVLENQSEINVDNPQENTENTNVPQGSIVSGTGAENIQVQTSMSGLGANIESQTIIENPVENNTKEINLNPTNNVPSVSENAQNQSESGQIRATLSLDEILDSELLSNPQFADNSKAVPNNVVKSEPRKMGISAFTWIGVLALVGLVAVLAFPSISAERKVGDTVDTGTVMVEPDTPAIYTPDEPEITVDNQKITGDNENPTGTHSVSVEIEVIDDDTEDISDEDVTDKDVTDKDVTDKDVTDKDVTDKDTTDEDTTDDKPTSSTEIVPYITEIEEEEPVIEESETISKNDIQQKISTFKTKGEKYKEMGEDDSNEKVIKYSAYIIRLCKEYEQNIENEEGIDEESLSEFETRVNGLLSKIEKNFGLEDVETIYSN